MNTLISFGRLVFGALIGLGLVTLTFVVFLVILLLPEMYNIDLSFVWGSMVLAIIFLMVFLGLPSGQNRIATKL